MEGDKVNINIENMHIMQLKSLLRGIKEGTDIKINIQKLFINKDGEIKEVIHFGSEKW